MLLYIGAGTNRGLFISGRATDGFLAITGTTGTTTVQRSGFTIGSSQFVLQQNGECGDWDGESGFTRYQRCCRYQSEQRLNYGPQTLITRQ